MTLGHEHIIDFRSLPQTKTRDKLFVRFNAHRSRLLSSEEREVSVYDVLNLSHHAKGAGTAYEASFWRDERGEKKSACTCEARRMCKHILRALALHVARKRALLARAA